MKINNTFKKSISILLTILMIFSTMVVGITTVSAISVGVWIVDNSGNDSTDWAGSNDCEKHKMVFNNTTQLWEHSYTATTNKAVKLYIKNQPQGQSTIQYCVPSGSSFGTNDTSKSFSLSSSWNTLSFTPEVGATYKFTAPYGFETFTVTKSGGSSGGDDTTDATVIPKEIYFKPGDWETGNNKLAAYFFDSTTENTWVECVEVADGVYKAVNENQYANVIFVQLNSATAALDWNNKSQQTGDLVIDTTGKNLYTKSSNSWSAYTGAWYVTGRFAVKGSDGKLHYAATNDDNYNWADFNTSDLAMTKVSDTEYTLDTGLKIQEMTALYDENPSTAADAKTVWYFQFANGASKYRPSTSANGTLTAADVNVQKSTVTTGNYSFVFDENATSTGTVTLHFNPSNHQFWFTLEGETPTDPSETDGQYTISDGTAENGTLTFKAEGNTAGTADAGKEVTITVNPASGYKLDSIQAVQENGTEVTITNNKFTMPAANVTVTATFAFDKDAYVASHSTGLWFDAAPSVTDTSATLVKWNNYKGSTHTSRYSSYTLYIPSDVSLSSVVLYNGYSSPLTIAGVTIDPNDHKAVDLSSSTTYTTSGATSQTVQVMQGSSSSMYFHTTKNGEDYSLPTATGAGSSKNDVKADGGTCVTIKDGTVSDSMVLAQVKGRGNSSWEASNEVFGKYAYNMKLDSATELFGLPKSKSYCLLANNADESMLRNALTYDLAKEIGLYDSPEFEFVDIYDNGEYHGTYFVCEKVDVAKKNKLIKGEAFDDINEEAVQTALNDSEAEVDENTNPGTYTYNGTQYDMQYCTVMDDTSSIPSSTEGTYLLEFEISSRYYNEASWFKSPKGQYVVVKSPEYATKEQVQYIAEKFAEMEATVYNSSSSLSDISNYIDTDSFAKMYLIQELSSNLDAAATSYYITVDCSGNTIENGVLTDNAKFVASPVWDYDWAYGQYQSDMYDSTKRYNYKYEEIKTDETDVWFAKEKSMDDSDNSNFIYKRNLQAELASHSAFQPVIKKVWNGTGLGDGNGFYDNVKNYYNTQLDTWHSEIADSMAMNEYRWKFIENNNIRSWGSADTGATLSAAVDFLKDWITDRSAWLNTQFASYSNYSQTVTPTLTAYTADGETELTGDVTQGTEFVLKATTTETYVTYKLYDGNTEVTSNTTGEFRISNATAGTHNYTVKTVTHSGNTMTSDVVVVNVITAGPVEVPNVVGMTETAAKTALTNAGFKVVVTTENSETVTAGLVISSDPEGGTTATYGSDVTIVVSSGPVVVNPTVPNVVGMLENDAKAELTALGYKVEVITASSDTVESGKVISSNPIAGTELAVGSTVTITVSTGPVPKEVITNVTIMFKGTNLKSLTPEFYFNGEKQTDFARVSKANGGYIGTYYTGAYGFYWYSVSLDEVTVGEDNVLRFKTTGTSMDATFTYDFVGCKSDSTLYFAVNNMYNDNEVVNITDSDAKKNTFRSAVNMISTENYASDPTLPKVSQAFLAAAGIATNKALTVGDTNADGDINIKDATAAQMMSAGYVQPTVASSVLGDFDLSGDVNIKDATDIQTHVVYN